ncbi:MAG: DNA mismatch repair protein MutS [Crocinitomicaceae bacterium]|nr:DNA mismatch repair protein MutS [Crocinitomicaceae bacterium]
MSVDTQTLADLEFDTIRVWLAAYAKESTARKRLEDLAPNSNFDEIIYQLDKTKEFLEIRTVGETFPHLEFEELKIEIKMLPIEGASISLDGFMRIHQASILVNSLMVFFEKRETEFPLLNGTLENVYYTKEITEAIEKVFDNTGNVKDNASELLAQIRMNIHGLKRQINKNFDRELRKLSKDNVLGDTRETFINDRRVLSILSSHKRKVSGAVAGSSNTGTFTYIEPQVNVKLNNELELLQDDERKEIFRILQILRRELKSHLSLITCYQEVLTEFDFINAKTRLAITLKCNRPKISDELKIELIDAFHPILWKNNKDQKKKTHPQSVELDKFSRMLVISGPNAGGKSITLKSVGLIQIMLQSGLLVPVHENSVMCFFQNIMSDIGDNQSIENELSTYSYRLKRMKSFLDVANRKSLFLIDEFGTGSDPDLGGALAESIFEAIYNKKSFGVITTHYSNIKLKADKLRNAQNGCMLFNTETLAPLYKLDTGQPGSSFTFEVATINGIPAELIADAKTKLDDKKVKMDQLLSDLQKEKNYLTRLNKEHIEAQEIAQDALNNYEAQKAIYDEKIKDIRENSISNDKLLQGGIKMKSFIDKYNTKSKKKSVNDSLLDEVKKYLAVERTKAEDLKNALKEAAASPKKKGQKKGKPVHDNFNRDKIKLGSKVKVISTKQSGTVEDISGTTIVVTFGFARMKVKLDKLQWIS